MGLLSAAVLLSQVALIRVFSVAQFYHFAFLVISLALLGLRASGSLLALCPRLRAPAWRPWYALGFALATPLAYLLVNALPFDSYAIAWDQTQLVAGAVAVGGVSGTGLCSGRGRGLAAIPQPAVASTSAVTTATNFIGSPPPPA